MGWVFLVGWDFRGTTLWDGIFIGYPMISKHITLYFLIFFFLNLLYLESYN